MNRKKSLPLPVLQHCCQNHCTVVAENTVRLLPILLHSCFPKTLHGSLPVTGKNYLFPWGFTVDGKRYEKMVPGRVARVFDEESRLTEQSFSREETSQIFRTAFLLFAGYVDAATTFALNCGGGGSAPDPNWGRDKNEDDILWTRRCFRKAREMVTTPVIRWGRRR